jgi:phosphate:Na+ symporter
MPTTVLTAIGGLGLFLLGMLILTDGLKNLVGGRLQAFLARRTNSPVSGAFAGAVMTAVLQSSSATTVAAVGFVGAGLLTFNQSLGIIFGANIGTTVTGWIVALIGFKLQLGLVLLPAVLLGVLLRLFAKGWLRNAGLALAGFGLLFVGIDFLQQGTKALEGVITPETFPTDTIAGRALLVLIGIAVTLVTQSSSAGVATAIVAVGAGSISFIQAAAIVIGMDIGTTFTAAIASLGGSVATRRTGFAHVIYNILTGVMAFAMLYPLQLLAGQWQAMGHQLDPQIGLVAFHSFFNLLGVIAVIGFTPQFARLIAALMPEPTQSMTEALDDRLLQDAEASTYAAGASTSQITIQALLLTRSVLRRSKDLSVDNEVASIRRAVDETRAYTDRIDIPENRPQALLRRKSIVHILDHVMRLVHRDTQSQRIELILDDSKLAPLSSELLSLIDALLTSPGASGIEPKLDEFRRNMRDQRHLLREDTISMTASRKLASAQALIRLDAVRWLHRVAYHLWRISVHLPELKREPEASQTPARGVSDQ